MDCYVVTRNYGWLWMAVFLPRPAVIRPPASLFHFARLTKQIVIISMLKLASAEDSTLGRSQMPAAGLAYIVISTLVPFL